MKSLVKYIKENLAETLEEYIDLLCEGAFGGSYFSRNPKKFPKYNFNLRSEGHAFERDMERGVTTKEVSTLFCSVWDKFKRGIENGKILINARSSKKPGSSVSIHSYEKTKNGYLTIVVFVRKYHKTSDYYDIEVVTTWKGKKIESFKDKDPKTGQTMHHPEKGQLDMWEDFAIEHYGVEDSIHY